jgi:predicted transglutaminase-like cysteine proteinase
MKNENKLKTYWNDKHPLKPIIYNGRAMPNHKKIIPIDVRQMFWPKDHMLSDEIKKHSLDKGDFDNIAWLCQKYIVANYRYVPDIKNINFNEYWQFPNETLVLKLGDCEDGSLLMASLMTTAGIPEWRIRVNAGWAINNNGKREGHGYVTYCRAMDNNWVVLDWCYHPDPSIKVKDKIIAKHNKKYQDIWFSFNSLYSWSHKNYDLFDGIYEEPRELPVTI